MIPLLGVLVLLGSCTEPVKMRNAATGEIASCGPYKNGIITGAWAAEREARCISDYQRQGFERMP